jgi:N-methylhydantoinase B
MSFDSQGRGRYMAGGADGVGLGAACSRDGQNAVFLHAGAGMLNIPCEVREKSPVPVLVTRYALRRDSGGAGKFRGGLGVAKDFHPLIPVTTISVIEKTEVPGVVGVDGGRAGSLNEVVFFPGTERETRRGKHMVEMAPAETVALRTSGGAGWGEPLHRDPRLVLDDVADGYVSREAAAAEYGVVLRNTVDGLEVDAAETARLRATSARQGSARSSVSSR